MPFVLTNALLSSQTDKACRAGIDQKKDQILAYLDDLVVWADSEDLYRQGMERTVDLLYTLGFW